MLCFSSSDPAAGNAAAVFDMNDDEANLWIRRGEDAPLPSCASSSPPPASQCTVCLERIVYAVCRNLTDGVDVTMETESEPVVISKSECPQLHTDDTPQWPLPVAIVFVTVIIVLIIIAAVSLRRRRSNDPERPDEPGQDPVENRWPIISGSDP